jgi:hypothetical protein
MNDLASPRLRRALQLQAAMALTLVWASAAAPVAGKPLVDQEDFIETVCYGWLDPSRDRHYPNGKPFGGYACWCEGESHPCTVRPERPAYDLYTFDVPPGHDGECWTFSTEQCNTAGCAYLPTKGVAPRQQYPALFKDEFNPTSPCEPAPYGWCGQTGGCQDPCSNIDPTIRQSLTIGHHFLVVNNDGAYEDNRGAYGYTLHVIHPVSTTFECPGISPQAARVVLVPGFVASGLSPGGGPAGHNCEDYFGDLINRLELAGIPRSAIRTVKTYAGDIGCDVDIGAYPANDPLRHQNHYGEAEYPGSHLLPFYSHTLDTSWHHLGYHLAWYLATLPGPVDLVGHSGGGLIIRYALMKARMGDEDFPPIEALDVQDVVTHGTPHLGLPGLLTNLCKADPWGGDRQCQELEDNSLFMKELKEEGVTPQGAYRTEWTVTGANAAVPIPHLFPFIPAVCLQVHTDFVVPDKSAVGMEGAYKVVWQPDCFVWNDPPMAVVTRSVVHSGFPSLLELMYTYYYDDAGIAVHVPADVDGTWLSDYYHVNYATMRALEESGR